MQHKPIDNILITVSSDASFLVMSLLILHSQFTLAWLPEKAKTFDSCAFPVATNPQNSPEAVVRKRFDIISNY